MSEIATSNILSTSFFTLAPIVRAAGGGEFVSGQAQALTIAAEQDSANFGARSFGQEAPPPRFVAFDSTGNLVDSAEQRGSLIDITA